MAALRQLYGTVKLPFRAMLTLREIAMSENFDPVYGDDNLFSQEADNNFFKFAVYFNS